MNFLVVDHVSHTYFTEKAAVTALENVSLEIEKGEFVSFLGPSGCGKTTLLSIIAALIQPTKGSVILEGEKVHSIHPSVGYMLQQDYLFPWKTIEENILLGLTIMGMNSNEAKQRALDLLSRIGLKGVETYYPNQLSGGMRQRAALVRTLATDPKILLLDEPFSALDYQTKLKLEELVWKTLKEYKKTALLVTHDIGEAIAMSDRIFLFSAKPGRLVRTFIVPKELRNLSPFHSRNHTTFSELFQFIWKELDSLEANE
ncbi:ABC transporter ATP-binding protein [Thermaerobacillus caldiproteolyticus]|uniref:NitT/TauT family transport system ATP-binding protein n=1 Tax=Thermaerobacillus caldiproteolyticus TaxID=247480 RepID=A0A7W0BXC9_9BACL|nr:ABC transporter ATP-binding protein [Anoxybacillus caldiproteolyticus]MBA2873893.1 NitT/TauT family transport system ATP-binding protein [Anoxybacillus caldiproteolyticus]QPA30440.1 ABC transporter ATP-binding protein [Anoxybacillus caldiproteolyticus]